MTSSHATFSRHERRPRWWSAFVSLLVALALVAQPACFCAVAESAHSHHHAATQQNAGAAHHVAANQNRLAAHHAHHLFQVPHDASTRAVLNAPHQSHLCCCDNSLPPVTAMVAPRIAAPQDGGYLMAASATLPRAQNVFALTSCHGRDGPTLDTPRRTQFFGSSFSSRAPPMFA